MSKTLVRGLEPIEELGLYARLRSATSPGASGVHVSIVSRTVAMLEPEGWMVRVDGKVAAGPGCPLLGLISPAVKTVRREEIEVNRSAIEACLRAAIQPGAGAQDIFDVAARAPGNDAKGGWSPLLLSSAIQSNSSEGPP
jgi:hypothetical protein